MSLGKTILERIRNDVPFRDHAEQFVAQEGPLTVRCELSAAEDLGCALTRLELIEEAEQPLDSEELAHRAERICSKVTYLLEPLKTIEVDRRAGLVLIRSTSGRIEDDRTSYYELLVTDEHVTTLRRYRYDASQRRRNAVEFSLTHDQLGLLIDDLIAALQPARDRDQV